MLKRLIRLAGLVRFRKHFQPKQPVGKASHFPATALETGKISDLQLPPPGNIASPMKLKAVPCALGHGSVQAAEMQQPARLSEIVRHDSLEGYLTRLGNSSEAIASLGRILMMDKVILETGCGGGEVALQIAAKNPQVGVIATDKYDLSGPAGESSHYQKIAHAWQDGCLRVQQARLPNLLILRSEMEILRYLPNRSIDSILVVNPEPLVGAAFVESIGKSGLLEKVKPGKKKIVIKPYSREMNVMSCGGYEFDHAEDWSCGLGFVLGGALPFTKIHPVQWLVDLSAASPYCKNSTQEGVYAHGDVDPT